MQEAVPSAAHAEETTEYSDASPYAELAASLAMLDFARKLPLEELSMIGCSLEPPLNSSANTTTALVDFSDYNHAERHAMAVEPKHPPQPIDCVAKPQNSVPEVRHFSSHTLSLFSESSGTTWSFTCRSARRIEGEHELPGINEDTATSFGSLSRWDVGDIAEPSPLRVQQVHHALNMSDAEFDVLLDYSDIEDDPAYDEPFIRDADVWSVSSAASSNTDEVYEETDETEAPNNHPAFMSDSDFDALPKCSDVEDDPEYNTQFERDEDIWSVTCTDSEETLVVPDIYDEDGFLDDAKDRLEEVTLRAKADEKKRKQESEGNDIPSKRRKLQQEILLMQEDIMRFEF
jgi:hypothetical protein